MEIAWKEIHSGARSILYNDGQNHSKHESRLARSLNLKGKSSGEWFSHCQAEEIVNGIKGDKGQHSHLCSSEKSEKVQTYNKIPRANGSHIQNTSSAKEALAHNWDRSALTTKLEDDATTVSELLMCVERKTWTKIEKLESTMIEDTKILDTYLLSHSEGLALEVSKEHGLKLAKYLKEQKSHQYQLV